MKQSNIGVMYAWPRRH